jgi:uncharacterized protein YecT (DUF1311 family)
MPPAAGRAGGPIDVSAVADSLLAVRIGSRYESGMTAEFLPRMGRSSMRASLTGLVALLAVAAVAGPARAQADDCDNAQASQADLNECYGKAFKASDAELNKLYKEITARLKDNPDTTRLLVATQRAWVAFRDAECNFQESAVAGGTAAPMIHAMCLDGQTKSRIEDFKTYLNCEEGDMSCPVPAAN